MFGYAIARLSRAGLLALALLGASATGAGAVPAFAVQTNQPCAACHVGGFGPQLTPFGRDFKMHGYTMRMNSFNVPLSAMAVASYVRTAKDLPSPPANSFGVNNNLAVDQVSLFLAGGVGEHFGGFVQATYDGVAKAYHWDNLDLRATTTTTLKGTDLVLGLSLNNAPTVQDPFNTVAAWGFPYTTTSLGVGGTGGDTSPIVGSLAQNTIGLTAYAWINSQLYVEFGGYRSPGARFLYRAGVDPNDPGSISGVAPYGRVAWQKNQGDYNFEVGAFVLGADIFPQRYASSGPTDHYLDVGLDGSFQYFAPHKNVVTVNARYTHERQTLDATQMMGGAANTFNTLDDFRIDASYYWHNKVGVTIGAFDTTGSADPLLYAANRTLKPDSSGLMFQLDGTPFGDGKSPLGPRFNMRVGLQYTAYFQFDGASQNFDNSSRNASDNNTVRVFTWFAY